MCRWIAYYGSPLPLEEVLIKPEYSLVQQSRASRQGAEPTNGDGFGMGWYGSHPEPGLYRSTQPAWNDANLQEIARHTTSPLFFAHIRSSTGSPVQRTNCHPFRVGRWLWMHNGEIRGFQRVKRELVLAIDPSLYLEQQGSTDSEVMFLLALTLGLADDPPGAVARMAGMVEASARRQGIEHPLQMTLATSDGERLWVFRYSSEGRSRSLYHSTDVRTLRLMYPHDARFARVSDESRLVVSEPLGDLPGTWHEVPEASCATIGPGPDELDEFRPIGADGEGA